MRRLLSPRILRPAAMLCVTLVVTPLSAQQAVPVLHATVDLRLDATEFDLSRIGWLIPMPDGELAVSQNEDHLIRFFDAGGKPAGTFGRLGSGPGEFRVVGLAGLVGDTLWVGDGPNARQTYIAPHHRLLRTERFPLTLKATPSDSMGLPSGTGAGLLVLARYPDGSFLTFAGLPSHAVPPAWFPAGATGEVLVRVSAGGVFDRVISVGPSLPPECRLSGSWDGTHRFTGQIPFCEQTAQAIATDGSRLVWVLGADVTGSANTYRVVVIGPRADTLLARDYVYRPLAISRHVADSVRESQATRPSTPPQAAAVFRHMTLPPAYPPVVRVLAGRDGTLWLETASEVSGHHWRILDARGTPVGEVTVPGTTRILAVERSRAWAIDTDEDGLQSVLRMTVR